MNPGTEGGGGVTRVGDDNLFMMATHVAHDCIIGSHVIMANNATLGGHCVVEDYVILGGLAAVHQHVRLGRGAMIGGLAGVVADVIPYGSVIGERAHLAGLNLVGLKRAAAARDDINGLRAAFGEMFEGEGNLQERVRRAAERMPDNPLVAEIVDFVADSVLALLHHPGGLSRACPADGLAIVAGRGDLPRLIAEDCARRGRTYRVVVFDGVPLDWTDGHPVLRAAFEKPGRLFADLRAAGCGVVTFAGGLARPALRLLRFDLTMLRLAPRLIRGIRSGDDATLRLVAAIFEAEGFEVRAPHEILTDLVAPAGVLGRVAPGAADRGDAARAARDRRRARRRRRRPGGGGGARHLPRARVRSRAPTRCSTSSPARLRPAAGPRRAACSSRRRSRARTAGWTCRRSGREPLRAAAAAGLAGVAIEAGGVMILGCAEAVAAADAAGLFLWARPPETQEGTATDFFARGGGL